MGRGRQARVAAVLALGLVVAARAHGLVRRVGRGPLRDDPSREAFLEERRARMRASRAALTRMREGGA